MQPTRLVEPVTAPITLDEGGCAGGSHNPDQARS